VNPFRHGERRHPERAPASRRAPESNHRRNVALIAVATLLTACSDGNAIPGASSSSDATPSIRQKAKATLTIRWVPAEKESDASIAVRRRPHFISPSAKSIEIYASTDGSSKYLETIVDKPKSGGTSSVSIDAPIGNDEFWFGVYDQANAQGTEIGGARLFQTIVAGKANVLKVTLDGYVDGAKLTYDSALMVSKLDAGGQPNYTLIGAAPVAVTLVVTDADGNVIVPPGTAPVATLTSTEPSMVRVTSSGSNTYTVQAIAPNPTGVVIGLQVSANSGAGGSEQFQTQFPTTEEAAIYAAYGAAGSAGVTIFDQHGRTHASNGFAGLSTPVAMAWDPADQRVLVADAGNGGTLLAFDPSGKPAKGWSSPAVPGINGVTYNPDTKAVYVTTTANGGAIKAFNAQGSPVKLNASAFSGLNNPIGIAYDSNAYNPLTPGQVNEFYVVNKPASASAFITAYVANGQPALTPSWSLGTNIPSGVAAEPDNQYGVAAMACYITANSNNIIYYGDNNETAGEVDFDTIATGEGLKTPGAIIVNPLANYSQTASNVISGPQPVVFYVANGTGGLDAIDGIGTRRDTSATFSPPAGANNFVALTMTY
jgi:hypothetical protein